MADHDAEKHAAELNEKLHRATWLMDMLVKACHLDERQSTAAAAVMYDAMIEHTWHEPPGEMVNADVRIAQMQAQQGPEVVWLTGPTLDWPTGLSNYLAASLVVPNNTLLDSTAELTQAVLARYPELKGHLERAARDEAQRTCGQVVHCPDIGRFASVVFAICREPGNPNLQGLEDCLRGALRGEHYRPSRAVIPVWGGAQQLDTWADALARIVFDAPMTQAGIRLPLILVFMPEDEQLGRAMEHSLISRGVLVGRDAEVPQGYWHGGYVGPEAIFECVRPGGIVSPRRFGDWCARGVKLKPELWDRHKRVWGEA